MATVTDVGLAEIANKLIGAAIELRYVHWGNSSVAEATTQTGLQGAETEARVSGAISRVTFAGSAIPNDTVQVVGALVYTAAATKTIREVGLFSAITGGVCIMRHIHSDTILSQNEGIEYTIQLRCTR